MGVNTDQDESCWGIDCTCEHPCVYGTVQEGLLVSGRDSTVEQDMQLEARRLTQPNVPKLPWPKLQTWPEEVRAKEWPAPAATLTKWFSLVPLMKRGCGCSTPISPNPIEYQSNITKFAE